MNEPLHLVCSISVAALFLGGPLAVKGQAPAPTLPYPESAKTFLDPVQLIVDSAPASEREKLDDDPKAAAKLNQYFAQNILGKSIVLHTKVESSGPTGVGWRLRADSIPVKWEGGEMKRESWLYFQPAD